jgi:N-formylglutamate deformylase
MHRYPFLLTIPHSGTRIPEDTRDLLTLTPAEITYYSDPATSILYHFPGKVAHVLSTDISRMVVDLNRPPYHLPPRHPDGVIKTRTVHGGPVYRKVPDITLIHRLLMSHYFPFHAEIDRLLDPGNIALALDCHSMLPTGPSYQKDAGKQRPAICLSNNGDAHGRQRPGTLATCTADLISALADSFRREFGGNPEVLINRPFTGGFITNAHFWHKGIPWVQIEVNRSLYETGTGPDDACIDHDRAARTGVLIWDALAGFWDDYHDEGSINHPALKR